MIVEADTAVLRDADEADVCIVGAGAAGIALALALAPAGRRVVVVEAGGFAYDPDVQQLFGGETAGDRFPALRDTRLAALGGSTGVWAGFCRPLEDRDFLARHGSPGWPFTAATLQPYWRRAHGVCQLGEYDYDPERWSSRLGLPLLCDRASGVHSVIFHLNAMRFGAAYRPRLEELPNVELILNAPVTCLRMSDDGRRVVGVAVQPRHGHLRTLGARRVVLAAGGIENARLLLLSGESPERAPGNAAGLVGRFFTDHPFVEPGYLELAGPPAPLDLYFPQRVGPAARSTGVRAALTLDPRVVDREGLLGGALLLHPRYESHDAFASAETASLLAAFARLRGKAVPGGAARDLMRALRAPRKVSIALLRKLLVRHGPAKRWRLRIMFETESAFDNHVALGERKDRFGRRLPRVEWRLTARDLASMRRFTAMISDNLQRSGIGRIDLTIADSPEGWRAASIGGKHHMGTTRMHVDAAQGVVDADCRVHGTTNLYVAGSSVFPSGGFANPTLTIVALALRLADHLADTA